MAASFNFSEEAAAARRQTWTAVALIGLATILAYSNSFHAPFVLDDSNAIADNPSIQDLSRLGQVLWAPDSSPTGGRPLLNLSFAINFALGGESNVVGYHVANLIIHVLAALALFGLARRTLAVMAPPPDAHPNRIALCIALIWALHPLQTESVTYISQRAESLMGLFYLLTLYAFVRGVQAAGSRFTGWFALSIVCACCGMATKEVMVTAPVIVLLYDRAFVSGSFRAAFSARRRYYLCLASSWLWLGFLMAASHISLRTVGPHREISITRYAMTELVAVARYLRLSLWPRPLVFDYGTDVYVSRFIEAAPAAAVIAASVLLAVLAWRRSKPAGFLALSFFILLAPTSSIVPVGLQPIAESRMYLPLAAVTALAVFALRGLRAPWTLPVALALSVGLAWASHDRNRDYASAIGLWQDTIAKMPTSSRAENCLGIAYCRESGHGRDAIEHFERALQLKPDFAEAHYNLAIELAKIPGRMSEVIPHLEQALLASDSAKAHFELGNRLAGAPGQAAAAIAHYETALKIEPRFAEAHNNLAVVLAKLPDRLTEAVAHCRQALQLRADYAEAHYNLANQLTRLPGNQDEAAAHYREALRIAPANAEARNNFAVLCVRMGNRQEAIRQLQAAVQLDPTNGAARANLMRLSASANHPAAKAP